MKEAALAVVAFFLLISSSFACNLCDELAKRGFSSGRLNSTLSGGFKADKARGHRFVANRPFQVDLLVEPDGRVKKNRTVAPLIGIGFYGSLNGQRARLFVADAGFVGINFVSAPVVLAKNVPQQIRQLAVAQQPSSVKIVSSKKAIRFSDEEIDIPSQ